MKNRNQLGGGLLALTLAGACFTASATVVYNWETLSTSDALMSASGELHISDAAWQAGSLSVDMATGSFPAVDSPIENFLFTLNDAAYASIDPVNAPDGFEGTLQADLSANPDGTSDGSLYANNTDTEVQMTGNDGIWQILMAGSDNPAIGEGCYFDHASCTATGQWLLDSATIPGAVMAPTAPNQEVTLPGDTDAPAIPAGNSIASVAEPGTQALFGLAVALIGGALWQRRLAVTAPRAV